MRWKKSASFVKFLSGIIGTKQHYYVIWRVLFEQTQSGKVEITLCAVAVERITGKT